MSKRKPRVIPEGRTKVITIKYKIPITNKEDRKFIHKPNCDVSKRLKKYLFDTLEYVCKKSLETEPEE